MNKLFKSLTLACVMVLFCVTLAACGTVIDGSLQKFDESKFTFTDQTMAADGQNKWNLMQVTDTSDIEPVIVYTALKNNLPVFTAAEEGIYTFNALILKDGYNPMTMSAVLTITKETVEIEPQEPITEIPESTLPEVTDLSDYDFDAKLLGVKYILSEYMYNNLLIDLDEVLTADDLKVSEYIHSEKFKALLNACVGKTGKEAILYGFGQYGFTAEELDSLFDLFYDVYDEILEPYVNLNMGGIQTEIQVFTLTAENINMVMDFAQRLLNITTPEKLAVLAELSFDYLNARNMLELDYSSINPDIFNDFEFNTFVFGYLTDLANVLADENSENLLAFIDFAGNYFMGENIFGIYSYREIVKQVNYIGNLGGRLLNATYAEIPLLFDTIIEKILENAGENAFLGTDYLPINVQWFNDLLKTSGDKLMTVEKFACMIMSEITENDIAGMYMDNDAAMKANTAERRDRAIATLAVRSAGIINRAYSKLSADEQAEIKGSISNAIELADKSPNSEELVTFTADDIIQDIIKFAAYDADDLSYAQIDDAVKTLESYIGEITVSDEEEI